MVVNWKNLQRVKGNLNSDAKVDHRVKRVLESHNIPRLSQWQSRSVRVSFVIDAHHALDHLEETLLLPRK